MTLSTRRELRTKRVEKEDPLMSQIGELGSEDEEYVNMLNCLETEDYNFAPEELKDISKYKTDLSVINLENGTGLVVRNGCEIFPNRYAKECCQRCTSHTIPGKQC